MPLGNSLFRRSGLVVLAIAATILGQGAVFADGMAAPGLPIVVARNEKPVRERLEHNVQEVIKTYTELKVPIPDKLKNILKATADLSDYDAIGAIQQELDKLAILSVGLNDEAWFSVIPASNKASDRPLIKGRWQTYLIKIDNASRVTSPIGVRSMQALSDISPENQKYSETCVPQPHNWSQWFLMRMIGSPLMPDGLSGQEVEYFVMQLCSLESGDRAAEFTFYLAGGQVSQGHYGSTMMVFKPHD